MGLSALTRVIRYFLYAIEWSQEEEMVRLARKWLAEGDPLCSGT